MLHEAEGSCSLAAAAAAAAAPAPAPAPLLTAAPPAAPAAAAVDVRRPLRHSILLSYTRTIGSLTATAKYSGLSGLMHSALACSNKINKNK